MTRFIIKTECNSTEANPNFKNEKHVFYYGKGETEVSDYNTYTKHIGTLIPWKVKKYGFTTKASAMKAYKHLKECVEYENARGFWSETVELVEVEV